MVTVDLNWIMSMELAEFCVLMCLSLLIIYVILYSLSRIVCFLLAVSAGASVVCIVALVVLGGDNQVFSSKLYEIAPKFEPMLLLEYWAYVPDLRVNIVGIKDFVYNITQT